MATHLCPSPECAASGHTLVVSLPWSDPRSAPLEDIRRYFVAAFADDIIATGSWGFGEIWFTENGTVMDIEEGLRRYG